MRIRPHLPGGRWGVTDAEVARPYPCDDLVPAPVLQVWRGVTVAAPADAVWPWVAQLRLAPYSYDWLDNRGRRSPTVLRGLPDPRPGEPFTTAATGPVGRVLAVEPGVSLTGEILGATMSYVLVPAGDPLAPGDVSGDPSGGGSTRLLLKLVMARGRVVAPFVAVGDLVMSRKQLLTWRELAEREHRSRGGRGRGERGGEQDRP